MKLSFEGSYVVARAQTTAENVALIELAAIPAFAKSPGLAPKRRGRGRMRYSDEKKQAILADLAHMTQEAAAAKHGVSKSFIYGLQHPGYFDQRRALRKARIKARIQNAVTHIVGEVGRHEHTLARAALR